jgi:hypothetical protein
MMSKFYSLAAGAALIALTGTAYEQEPAPAPAKHVLQLSDSQMGVTAGGVGIANGVSLALGEITAVTFTQTSTFVNDDLQIAIGQAFSQALASGGFLFQAAVISHADTAASLD